MTTIAHLETALAAIAAEAPADIAHDAGHIARVWQNTRMIAETEGGDLRILVAAAHLHDLVALPKDHPDRARASRLSARAATPHLERLGYTEPEVAATAHAIEAHSFSANIPPRSSEARILRDADRLDALGAIGLARFLMISGSLGRPLCHPTDPFATARALDDRTFALDHMATKLLPMARDMATATGARLAKDRLGIMHAFLADLAAQTGHPLPPDYGASP